MPVGMAGERKSTHESGPWLQSVWLDILVCHGRDLTPRGTIFAVGDVRGGNVKRVASAVGEGSIAISFVHQL